MDNGEQKPEQKADSFEINQQISRNIEAIFELNPSEVEVYEKLNDKDKRVYRIFRDSFALSMGSRTEMIYILDALTYFNKSMFEGITYGRMHNSPPEFLYAIRAPKNHVRSGRVDDPNNNAATEIIEAWKALWFSMDEQKTEDTIYNFLKRFVIRDSEYVKGKAFVQDGEGGGSTINVGRATTKDNRTSFFREFILKDQYDSLFCTDIQDFLQYCRGPISKLEPLIKMSLDSEIAADFQKRTKERFLQDKEEDSTYDLYMRFFEDPTNVDPKIRPAIEMGFKIIQEVLMFEIYAGYNPEFANLTNLEKDLFKSIRKLILIWEASHEGGSFFDR